MDERGSATDVTGIESAAAVVLAGGQSTRFGDGEKAAATVGGESLLVRAVGAAGRASGSSPIVAVASPEQRDTFRSLLADESVRFVLDAPDREGPLAGLASATETATADWLLVLGCDMPLVDDRAVEWLAARRSPDLDAVVPADDGGIHPLHAWYRREAVTAALSTLPSDASLRALLDRLSVDTLTADRAPPDADLERSVRNVNTVEDLEAARRAWQDR